MIRGAAIACMVVSALVGAATWVGPVAALDNGFRVPPMGWSSWYGFTSHINETMLEAMGDGMVSLGLHAAGYDNIWLDDGWAIARDNSTGRVIEDPALFPSGMGTLVSRLHAKGLKFGIYTSKGPLTCLGYQKTQPNRPGSCGFEQNDADTYAQWGVDAVKDDGCGACPQHDPWIAMRDALNKTGRPMWFAIHPSAVAMSEYPQVSNMWRTGGDLSSSSYSMWTNRLDLATAPAQAALVGAGAFANPDFLEVGYSPRNPKGGANVQSALEQRAMFTMWAALPGPLILSADLRAGAACGGIDKAALATLTNAEVIAVNQDALAAPMRIISNASGLQVWRKPLAAASSMAVVFFHRGNTTAGPLPPQPPVREVCARWADLGLPTTARVSVRDLWTHTTLGSFTGTFSANVTQRDARMYTFTTL